MPLYAIGILPLLETVMQVLREKKLKVKNVAYADDITGAGRLVDLKVWWDAIGYYGPYIGYYVNPAKSWLIVKPHMTEEASLIFADSNINVTCEGRKHLGAVIGCQNFKNKFINNLVDDWIEEIQTLSKISQTEPHAAYSAYINGMQNKYIFFMRTIPNISQNLKKLDASINHFITNLLSYDFSENERILFSLPVKFGGLGIKIP